ncbi:septin-5 isoform X2 [Neocloeon triangulifer]|uniref:septin-5 isoform X2 n=1 Tax=Neocloeon triangulifer TaxID=2078957 RepID=UPI00286F9589|nr:septin-5 isoform X2 [Neocloeon triangulifer]
MDTTAFSRMGSRRSDRRIASIRKKKGRLVSDRDYIGFATLPEQVHRKSVKRGFEFTLMVVGESGLGKSTLVNSLFLSDLYNDRVIPDVSELVSRTTAISKQTMDIEERGVRLRLSVVDTPGFGDALDGEDSWRAVCTYVEQQFSQYFQDESGLHRKNIQDNRIHCCLYFVPPYGHGLRQLDVEFMKRLQNKVNLVPVIAKADTLTHAELKKLKDRVLADLEENNVQIYQFPDCDSDEDDEFKKQDEELKKCVPFAVIASNTTLEVNGKKVRGRQYPWGVVEVDNPQHSDFARLRSFLVSTHMQDLKDVTHDLHYEAFRAHCIAQISQQAMKDRGKSKRDSTGPHLDIGTETDRLLLQKDEEIRRMQDMLVQMQQKLHKQSSTGSQGNLLDELTVPANPNQRDSVVDV